ncbi:CREB/ATF bZIP transcription factor-like isoform X2 [Watersipora subatra]|uniref:CREB/ATF bZIP transcription factor-like isoform X2 n=1 Tax=Watersipora subatra TaxID=2589382 RepID=UPI00355B7C36
MLSPPCSSEGDIDDSLTDYDRLFPELGSFGVVKKVDASSTTLKNRNPADHNSVVHLPEIVPNKEVLSTCTNNHGSKKGNNDCTNDVGENTKVPKYVDFKPENGFAVCGPFSKNAILARENRRKKKEYVTTLESEIHTLSQEKLVIQNDLQKAHMAIDHLNEEIGYLKSVIANHTTLGALLKNIPNTPGVNLKRSSPDSTSDETSKRHKGDHEYSAFPQSVAQPGVCLHVSEGSVSLEFCKQCNVKSTQLMQA